MTRLLPAWPRADVQYSRVGTLSQRMRTWYFSEGGIYLTTDAMARYRMAQEALQVFSTAEQDELLDDREYEDVRRYLSRLRTALTVALLSRAAPFEVQQSTRSAEHEERSASSNGTKDPTADAEHVSQNSNIRASRR